MSAKPVSASPVGWLVVKACPLLIIVPLLGCGELEPCPGVAHDMRIELEVIGPSEPEDSCLEDWGFASGVVVEGRVAKLSGENDCRSGVPEIEQVGEWSWTRRPNALIRGGPTLEGLYTVTRDTCSAGLWLIHTSESFGCAANRGELCVLEARINPVAGSDASCPPRCSGQLDVRAERL